MTVIDRSLSEPSVLTVQRVQLRHGAGEASQKADEGFVLVGGVLPGIVEQNSTQSIARAKKFIKYNQPV